MAKASLLLNLDRAAPGAIAKARRQSPAGGPPPRVAPHEPAAVAVQTALTHGLKALLAVKSAAKKGDPEGVHKMRTSTRRLRSVLRTYSELLDSDWADALEEELKWVGHILGSARDLDVLLDRLTCEAEKEGVTAALEPLFERLRVRRESARKDVVAALDGARFGELCGRLTDAADRPHLRDDAWEACRTALPPLARDAWQRLKGRARDLSRNDHDEEFHEVRKRAKHVRYASEAVANALGPHAGREATRFAKKARKVQDILGTHQDATIARQEIANLADQFDEDHPFHRAASKMIARQEESARNARSRFFKIWAKLDDKKLRRWLKV